MRKTIEQRFWEKVDKNGSVPAHKPELGNCWQWIGSIATDGYGKLKSKIGNRLVNERAHRVAWKIQFGEIPDGKLVCHHCDNVLCVRGSHLFIGTNRDNVRDMISKKRQRYNPVRKLTPEQVLEMRTTPIYRGIQKHFMKKFNVHQTTISDVFTRRTWPTLTA